MSFSLECRRATPVVSTRHARGKRQPRPWLMLATAVRNQQDRSFASTKRAYLSVSTSFIVPSALYSSGFITTLRLKECPSGSPPLCEK